MTTQLLTTNGATPVLACKMSIAQALTVSIAGIHGLPTSQGPILGTTPMPDAGARLREGMTMEMVETILHLLDPLLTALSHP